MTDRFLGVFRQSAFSSGFDRSRSRNACRVLRNRPANSAQEFEALMSTIRTASMRDLGGSTPKRRGGPRA